MCPSILFEGGRQERGTKAKVALYYTIFKTGWGWFGLFGDEEALIRTSLPSASRCSAEKKLLSGLSAQYKPDFRRDIQKAIKEYFEGNYTDFGWIPFHLDGFSGFQKRVFCELKKIGYARTITYKELSEKSGFPSAARAVGRVMAANPLPLVLPCHRVVCSDGSLGGFSAQGGQKMKERLLRLEKFFSKR